MEIRSWFERSPGIAGVILGGGAIGTIVLLVVFFRDAWISQRTCERLPHIYYACTEGVLEAKARLGDEIIWLIILGAAWGGLLVKWRFEAPIPKVSDVGKDISDLRKRVPWRKGSPEIGALKTLLGAPDHLLLTGPKMLLDARAYLRERFHIQGDESGPEVIERITNHLPQIFGRPQSTTEPQSDAPELRKRFEENAGDGVRLACPTCGVPVAPARPICPKCGARVRLSRPA